MSTITREILRDELRGFAMEAIRKELADFKNELVVELSRDRFDAFSFCERAVEEDVAPFSAFEAPAELPARWPSPTWGGSDRDSYTKLVPTGDEHTPLESSDGLRNFVKSDWFERFILGCILANLFMFVFETDYLARNWATSPPPYFFQFEIVLLSIFTVEITLRIIADGISFFVGPDAHQNLFDFCLVLLQGCEVGMKLLKFNHKHFVDVLRVLRVTRIFRAGRIVHLVPALHILFSSIASSLESLMWILMLVLLTVGCFAVALTQIVTDHKVALDRDALGQEILQEHFGTVDITMLKLYQVMTDGLHWCDLSEPLMFYVSPWAGLIMIIYSAFITFALLNVVTAVFVESAVAEAQQDHQKHISNRLWKNFQKAVFDVNFELTEQEFMSLINIPAMQDYLRKLGLDTDRAKEIGLFHLLDRDKNGRVSSHEIMEECVRLLGYARAVDLAALSLDVHQLQEQTKESLRKSEELYDLIANRFGGTSSTRMSATMSRFSRKETP